MSSTTTSLGNLPVEIVQRIATFCSCSSALSLLRVCHALHNGINNKHVFRDIITNCNSGETPTLWLSPQQLGLTDDDHVTSLQKWALADEKARAFLTDPTKSRGFETWAPMLMAVNRKTHD